MNRSRIAVVTLVLVLVILAGCTRLEPPLSPQHALKTFQLPAGFHIELVASEPEISDPVAMAFDEQGRLWVVEMSDYPMQAEPQGKIKLLEDLDGDGKFEKSTVFVKGLHFPNGVLPWKGGILVTCAPDILYFADTDGDKRADVRRIVLTGFAATNPQLRMNGLQYGIDNWVYGVYLKTWRPKRFIKEFGDMGRPIHFPDHPEVPPVDLQAHGMDFRFRPDELKLEAVAGNSQFGNTFDALGNRFTVFNNDHIRQVVLQNQYLTRNPFLAVESAMVSISDHQKSATVYPTTEKPTQLHDSEIGHFTSACGISAYTGGQFPAPYDRSVFVCEPVHNLIHCDLLKPKGAIYAASRALEHADFLTSKDSWFHPVFTAMGPDGALYVVDYYRKHVEHSEWVPDELINKVDLREGHGRGRIYRVVYEGRKPSPKPHLRDAQTSELLMELGAQNMWRRITAQRLLVERHDSSIVAPLRDLARNSTAAEGQVHALWTLEGLGALDANVVLQALADHSPEVRKQAVRLAENYLSESTIRTRLTQMAEDPDDRVAFQLACTLGLLPARQSFKALWRIAMRHIDELWFQNAVLTAAADNASQWFKAVFQTKGFLAGRDKNKEEFLRQIASVIGARQQQAEIAALFATMETNQTSQNSWWRAATLRGLAEGLGRGSLGKISLQPALQRALVESAEARAPEVRTAALDVASHLQLLDSPHLRAALKRAHEIIERKDAEVDARADAVRFLSLDPKGSSVAALSKLLTPEQPLRIQLMVARTLANLNDSTATEKLLNSWATLPASVKETVLDGLFKHPDQLQSLLEVVERGKIQPWSLSRSRRSQLTESANEKIRRRAEELFSTLQDDRKQVIDRYRPAVRVNGSFEQGREVFSKKCSKCHKVGDIGFEVGPDLASLTNRNKLDLLTQILDPNAYIAPGYEEYVVETKDGRTIDGVVVNESATAVRLRQGGGEEQTVLRSGIASLHASTVSMMPEGLEKEISIQNMTDLLEFLKNIGGPIDVARHTH